MTTPTNQDRSWNTQAGWSPLSDRPVTEPNPPPPAKPTSRGNRFRIRARSPNETKLRNRTDVLVPRTRPTAKVGAIAVSCVTRPPLRQRLPATISARRQAMRAFVLASSTLNHRHEGGNGFLPTAGAGLAGRLDVEVG